MRNKYNKLTGTLMACVLLGVLLPTVLPTVAPAADIDVQWVCVPQRGTNYLYNEVGETTNTTVEIVYPDVFIIKSSTTPAAALATWPVLTNVSAFVNEALRTNVVLKLDDGPRYFYMLSSNKYGISPFSNVPWMLGPPNAVDVKLKKTKIVQPGS